MHVYNKSLELRNGKKIEISYGFDVNKSCQRITIDGGVHIMSTLNFYIVLNILSSIIYIPELHLQILEDKFLNN